MKRRWFRMPAFLPSEPFFRLPLGRRGQPPLATIPAYLSAMAWMAAALSAVMKGATLPSFSDARSRSWPCRRSPASARRRWRCWSAWCEEKNERFFFCSWLHDGILRLGMKRRGSGGDRHQRPASSPATHSAEPVQNARTPTTSSKPHSPEPLAGTRTSIAAKRPDSSKPGHIAAMRSPAIAAAMRLSAPQHGIARKTSGPRCGFSATARPLGFAGVNSGELQRR